MDQDEADLKSIIRDFTLQNALQYGKPDPKAVMGKVLSEKRELKSRAKEIFSLVQTECKEVAGMSLERIELELRTSAPDLLEKKEHRKTSGLPDLPHVHGEVVMRFAPGPSGPLHIGHSRAAILNDEYVKRYGGTFILRLEDTNPVKILDDAYDMILWDMDWLETTFHQVEIQSDRFQLYIDYAKKIIEIGKGYVCSCPVEHWRELKNMSKACPHRDRNVEVQLEDWDRMLSGHYQEGEASLMVKTDLKHVNPAIRDFVAMRIMDHSHPRTGDRYRVYPLYNFSVAIDDHFMGMTHVLRGKDHLNNTYKQRYIYQYFKWDIPEFIHYGWVSIPDTLLKTSSIKEGITRGEYSGWDDLRLGTFQALAKRGFRADAIRRYWIEVGIKEVDIHFSWKTLIAYNKEIIDPISPRYFFVSDPVTLTITGVDELTGRAPLFPDNREKGIRNVQMTASDGGEEGEEKREERGIPLLIQGDDADNINEGEVIRLKDLGNVRILHKGRKDIVAEYQGNDLSILKQGARNIHWCPKNGIETTVYMPDGSKLEGKTEPGILDCESETVQFERFAFVRIEKQRVEPENHWKVEAYFTHK